MTQIIITAIIIILVAILFFCIGHDVGITAALERLRTYNNPSPVETLSRIRCISRPDTVSTRYIRMNKDDTGDTNSLIETLEDDGYQVIDYDTDDGIITMEKRIGPKEFGTGSGHDEYIPPTPPVVNPKYIKH